jgi:hypothetical protein
MQSAVGGPIIFNENAHGVPVPPSRIPFVRFNTSPCSDQPLSKKSIDMDHEIMENEMARAIVLTSCEETVKYTQYPPMIKIWSFVSFPRWLPGSHI